MEDPVVLLERNLYGHPLARLVWERAIRENLVEVRLGENFPFVNGLIIHRELAGKNSTLIRRGKYPTKKLIWWNQHVSLTM